jgi:hypothetical protein
MKYNILFELYGKRMKTELEANSVDDAKYQIMGKIKFHKIEPIDEEVDRIKKMLGIFD